MGRAIIDAGYCVFAYREIMERAVPWPCRSLRRGAHTAQTSAGDGLGYQAITLCVSYELVHRGKSSGIAFGHGNRHLDQIETSFEDRCTRQLRCNSVREVNVLTIHIGTISG